MFGTVMVSLTADECFLKNAFVRNLRGIKSFIFVSKLAVFKTIHRKMFPSFSGFNNFIEAKFSSYIFLI